MPSHFAVTGLDFDVIFKQRISAPVEALGYKVHGIDISGLYEPSASWGSANADQIAFDTNYHFGGIDLRYYFQSVGVIRWLLTVTDGTGGGEQDQGYVYTIIADSPPSNKHWVNWTSAQSPTYVGGTSSTDETAQVTITENTTVVANFAWDQYTLTVTYGSGDGTFDYNASMAISADAAPSHQHFETWTDPVGSLTFDSATSASTNAHFAAAGNATAEATYAWNQYTLTVNYGTGGGTQDYGYVYTVTATVPSYKYFTSWSNGGNLSYENGKTSTDDPTDVSISASTSITANFSWIEYDVQANNGSGGTSTVINGDGTGSVIQLTNNNDQDYTLVANPSDGYYFVNWTGDTTNVASTTTASTTVKIRANTTVSSNFAAYEAPTGISWSEANPSDITSGQVISLSVTPTGGTSPFVYDWWIQVDGGSWDGPHRDGNSHNFGAVSGTTNVVVSVDVRCQGHEATYYNGNDWVGNFV